MSKKRGLAQNIRDIKRFEQILAALIKFELGYVVDKLSLTRYLPLSKRKRSKKGSPEKTTPNKVVKLFEHLGGTFIKLGQLLSIRPDLLPHDYCDAFRKLQDNVPAFSSEEAIKIIEQELGKPIKKLFSSFKRKPITAASIGQVHEAILLNGERVAIKVQRPKIREVVESDIDILYKAASLIEKHY